MSEQKQRATDRQIANTGDQGGRKDDTQVINADNQGKRRDDTKYWIDEFGRPRAQTTQYDQDGAILLIAHQAPEGTTFIPYEQYKKLVDQQSADLASAEAAILAEAEREGQARLALIESAGARLAGLGFTQAEICLLTGVDCNVNLL